MEMFFSSTPTAAAASRPPRPTSCSSTPSDLILLLSGPPSCGKTSMLFQFALNSISPPSSHVDEDRHRSRRYVEFMCSRRKLQANPPYLSMGIDPSSDIFSCVQIKYVECEEDVKKYFAAFHLHESFPVAVIVDDFGDFFDQRYCQERYANSRGRDLAMVRTLALGRNAMLHANLMFVLLNFPVKNPLASFCYLIPITGTPQGFCSFTRDGYPPYLQSKVYLRKYF
ncbi:hypothetical protein Dimus_031611 [Dionaea muscipula]